MNVYIYNAPVDPSYKTGWFRLPYERMTAAFSIPSIPLSNEMVIDIPNDAEKNGGFNYVILETNGDVRGFFVKDMQVLGDGVGRRLHLTVDHWVTGSILNQVQWQGTGATLPNSDIATGLYYVGSDFPSPWTFVHSLDKNFFSKFNKTAIIFTCTAKTGLVGAQPYYYTVISPTFTNYTEFQQWYNVILRADVIAYKLGTESGYGEKGDTRYDPPIADKAFNFLTIDTIESIALMPYPDGLEINRDMALHEWVSEDIAKVPEFVYHDIPATVGNKDQITNATPTGWTILGNLLGDYSTFKTAQNLWVIPSPRVYTSVDVINTASGVVLMTVIGNSGCNVLVPGGCPQEVITSITLTGGVNPCKVTLTINGELLDLTASLNLPFFVTASRDQDEKNMRRWGYSLLGTAVGGVASALKKDYMGAASSVLSLASTTAPQRTLSSSTGDIAAGAIFRGASTNIFTGTITAVFLARGVSDGATPVLQNSCGDRYIGRVAFNFFYKRPPTNYETIGVFQIDNPRPIPIGYHFSPNVSLGECCKILQQGIYLYAPDNPPQEVNADGSLNLTDDML